ncbi:mandelate racemase/muconate lactonizing enzyme family protein [Amnibacterium setariae]|uniref:Mandelate racemase/muconate lactonizing enzyme family protein n=1 Tax=Amnibacterium setariae TaxID=2306585 RepID=A0A3A1TX15_9MICO|nr:mandelate racemase/muconate lactonizing enzyme family protein [Amnibacterium setariae]RIX28111.1 mandelate racemase/muconate lactonizing enzyme family protein [Amnibacterium setariae]
MRITRVVPWLVRAPGTFWGEYLFVEVRTDEGVSGWGEITTTTRTADRGIAAMVRQLNDLVIGDDPARIEDTWHKVFRAFTYMGSRGAGTLVTSAIDIALWDIRGKVLGVPVADLLGGRVRDDVAIYTHPDQSAFTSRDGIEQELGAILASGHDAIKIDPFPHLDGASPANDRYLDGRMSAEGERIAVELTAVVREVVGPDVDLLIDAHARFDVPTAIRMCAALQAAGSIDWFEEPVPPESRHALRQVKEQVSVPIAVGERLHTRWDFAEILHEGLTEYAMPDVTWTGGISELKKISTLAETYYVPMTPHDASGPINLVAGAQVMLTVPNFYRIETSAYDLGSYDRFLTAPLDNTGGRLRLGSAPGLGIELDLEYLRGNVLDGFGER